MTKLTLFAVCVSLAAECLPAEAGANAAPTLVTKSMTTTGVAVPALVAGQWSKQSYGWSIDLSAMAVPGGATTVESHWTSSTFRVVRHETFFRTDAVISHQGVPGGLTYTESARLCVGRNCDPWFTSPEVLQNFVDPASLPFTVETGHGLLFRWSSRPALVRVEWRYIQVQSVADCIWTRINIGVGKNSTQSIQHTPSATNPVVAGCVPAVQAAA